MKNATHNRIQFIPVAILKNGVLYQDGHMAYTDTRDNWLYVSEDGQTVVMYNNVADLIRDVYKKDDNDDYVVTGWDMEPYRFSVSIDELYNYYNARFEE
jgi:hypothetical protein